MKVASCLLWIAPVMVRAFLLPSSTSHHASIARRRQTSKRSLPFAPPSSPPSFRLHSQFMEKELDLTQVTAEVQAALDAAETALKAEARGRAPWRASSLASSSRQQTPKQLSQDIDNALEAANHAMTQLSEALELELRQYDVLLEQAEGQRLPPASLLVQMQKNSDLVFGDQAKQVLELLRKGFLKPQEYKAYIQEQKEESRRLKRQVATQANQTMDDKRNQAYALQDALLQADVRFTKSTRTLQISTIAMDGAMVGSVLGFYLWTSVPVVGLYVPLAVPMLYASGVLACASIVAATSTQPNNLAKQFLRVTKFGFVSRALWIVMRAVWNVLAAIVRTLLEAIAAVPMVLVSSVALWVEDVSEAMADGLNAVIAPITDKQRELSEKLEERRIK